jgi:hypothetical protein
VDLRLWGEATGEEAQAEEQASAQLGLQEQALAAAAADSLAEASQPVPQAPELDQLLPPWKAALGVEVEAPSKVQLVAAEEASPSPEKMVELLRQVGTWP